MRTSRSLTVHKQLLPAFVSARRATEHSSQAESLEMRADDLVAFARGVFEPPPLQDANSSIPPRDQP
jgi:hypothetical protein